MYVWIIQAASESDAIMYRLTIAAWGTDQQCPDRSTIKEGRSAFQDGLDDGVCMNHYVDNDIDPKLPTRRFRAGGIIESAPIVVEGWQSAVCDHTRQ